MEKNAFTVESYSDSDNIEDSYVVDDSFQGKKKAVVKNHTVFVAESEESVSEDTGDVEEKLQKLSENLVRRSSTKTISSSEDDASKRGSIRRQSETSSNKLVLSSSDEEEEYSPEILPRRRPLSKNNRLSESFIGRKTKKRLMVLDSESDNSFIIEHQRRGKLACLKDTPEKIETAKPKPNTVAHMSFQDYDDDEDDTDTSDRNEDENDDNDGSENEDENDVSKSDGDSKEKLKEKRTETLNDSVSNRNSTYNSESDEEENKSDESGSENEYKKSKPDRNSNKKLKKKGKESFITTEVDDIEKRNSLQDSTDHTKENDADEDDDDGLDEDQMIFSRATRMSIMGYLPKENESDDSDYIESDDTKRTSNGSLTSSVTEPAQTHSPQTLKNVDSPETPDKVGDSSRLTCSPIASPLRDITNETNNSFRKSLYLSDDAPKSDTSISLIGGQGPRESNSPFDLKNTNSYEKVIDEDVTIIDRPPEIIALSSDDEDVVVEINNKSPNTKRSKVKSEDSSQRADSGIKQFLVPASYPNQVVYVKKQVRENELAKLNGLKEELQNIRYLLEHMEMETLPDGGVKLIERLTALEADVRRQGDKVAAMVVEPDAAEGAAGGPGKAPTWEDIQKASNAVQPRMFGKQAMATHMAERNLIMERLRDLHESLASRPPELRQAAAPRALRTALMPHQLHALAWLRWRETQRPPGGILADDMGLGKTITMISLIAQDKEDGIDHDEQEDDGARGRVIRGGTLVVCPASLLQQWAGEVSKHCAPHALSVAQHHGATRAQHPHRLAASDLVLTTYNILQRESEKAGALTKVTWRRVILDEAHVVRNHKSATSAAVAALRARRRWALTGTPLHNKDLDLFALLKFLKCTPFDDLTMWKKWIDNKSMGGEERLSMIMRCLMLRRTKAQLQGAGQLACLPARTAHERRVTLSAEEMGVYQKVMVTSKTLFAQYLHQRAEKQADVNGLTRMQKDNAYALHKRMAALQGVKPVKSHEILVLLLRLRQMCCHCGLIAAMLSEDDAGAEEDPAARDLLQELDKLSLDDSAAVRKGGGGAADELDGAESGGEGEGEGEGASVGEAIRSVLSLRNPVFRLDRPSAKIAAVMDCLNNNVFPNKGEKAVVVSQWTSVLRLVERELAAARVRCVTLCGAVPVPARAALVAALNDANSDVRVMLLSLCAGGVGLNLCGASHLLLLDPHWNPQLEQQAQDRVYRVGQTRPVHIYRFMCVDTVEQSIRALQAAKLELAETVLTGARHAAASKLTIDDLKMLFNMGPADRA